MLKENIVGFLEKSKEFLLSDETEKEIQGNKDRVLKILIIEDDEMIIELPGEIISDKFSNNVSYVIARSIKEIQDILGSGKHFDYVFLDGNLRYENTKDITGEISDRFHAISISGCPDFVEFHKKNGAVSSIDKINIPDFLEDKIKRD